MSVTITQMAVQSPHAPAEIELPFEPASRFDTVRNNLHNIGMAAALSGIAAVETWAYSKGYVNHLGGALQEVSHHVRHLSLGNIGAWIGNAAARNRSPKTKAVAMFAGVTAMNFGVGEYGQMIMLGDEGSRDLANPANITDNSLDYLTAIAGGGIFVMLHNYVAARRELQQRA